MEGLNGNAGGKGGNVRIECECCRERRKVNAGWEGEGMEAKVG